VPGYGPPPFFSFPLAGSLFSIGHGRGEFFLSSFHGAGRFFFSPLRELRCLLFFSPPPPVRSTPRRKPPLPGRRLFFFFFAPPRFFAGLPSVTLFFFLPDVKGVFFFFLSSPPFVCCLSLEIVRPLLFLGDRFFKARFFPAQIGRLEVLLERVSFFFFFPAWVFFASFSERAVRSSFSVENSPTDFSSPRRLGVLSVFPPGSIGFLFFSPGLARPPLFFFFFRPSGPIIFETVRWQGASPLCAARVPFFLPG